MPKRPDGVCNRPNQSKFPHFDTVTMFSFSVKNVDMQDAKRGYHADIHFPWNVDDLVWNICPQNKKSVLLAFLFTKF